MSVGFGIVGCGMIANFHARALADATGAQLLGCTSNRRESAEKFAAEHGGQAFDSLEEMLAAPGIDAVAICTPSGNHLDPGLAAAAAGKHVFVEKPLEITVERCNQLIEACEKAGVKLGVAFQSRFHESSRAMKRAVEEGRFGTVTLGDAYVKWYRSQEYYDSGAWRGTWKLDGGGALMNQAIHTVDLLSWVMGPVAEISAFTSTLAHERIEVEDVAVANLRFANGALGVIEATTASYPGALKRIEVSGSKGSAVLEEEDIRDWDFAEPTAEDEALKAALAGKTETGGGASDPAAIGHHGHTCLFNDFVEAIREDRQPAVCGREGRRSVEIICAIYESAQQGKIVRLQ
ncbi:Gfo/Idh/MocA family protein [Roseimaritima sediminicola]|uniref:Gfo/Idh/MocA family protein n=1 Tax=Roseimaritima sediminicola TaxID=2662066 RepID=UPI0012982C6C|nr:Gfo/Idh/MocA family oxidoreductase [Roseimaritima sediminicola]